jgi:hypothetical protein
MLIFLDQKGISSNGIHYVVGCTLDLIGFIDSYWDGDSIYCKSTPSYVLSLGPSPICWSSKKQSLIALSSVEAEYIEAIKITIQELWI